MKVKQLNHSYSRLFSYEDYERVKDHLSYWKVFWRNGKREYRQWRMVYKNSLKFATGLIPYLEEVFKVDVVNGLNGLGVKKQMPELEGITFFRDQVQVFERAREQKRGVIKAPTGSGKTVVGAGLIDMYQPAKCLFLVHTLDLLHQTRQEFERLLQEDIGLIGDGNFGWQRVTVATMQTLKDVLLQKEGVDMVICDECHHCPSPTYRKILNRLTGCSVRYGLSATPRKDTEGKLWTHALLGGRIADISTEELIRRGRLSTPTVEFRKVPFNFDIAQLNEYRDAYNQGIVYYDVRNRMIWEAAKELERKGTVLVTVKEVRQGEELQKLGVGVFVQGSTKTETRERIKTALKNKKVKTVICSPVWDEGVDVPSLDAVIVAGGGLSEIKALQKVGRALRRTKDKSTVKVVDFLDLQHGWLRKHSRERRKVYAAEGWEVGGVPVEQFDGRRMRR